MDDRIKKLPVWAQSLIHCLRDSAIYWKGHVQRAEKGETTQGYDYYGNQVGQTHLPDALSIFFMVNGEPVFVRVENDVLEVRGYTSLKVIPWASNVVKIEQS